MQDEFAGRRLPDLPNAGYATRREKQFSDEIMSFIRGCERNRILLLTIVCARKDKARRVMKKAWKHLKADDEMVDAVFGYLVLIAGEKPEEQLDHLQNLDKLRAAGLWAPTT